jgi:hypothetical protein
MKKHFWAIWQGKGVLMDKENRPLIFPRLVDAKVWMIEHPFAHARIVKCHIQEEEA